jgi:predicted lipoprotein with Yx(FWY)xxD motif
MARIAGSTSHDPTKEVIVKRLLVTGAAAIVMGLAACGGGGSDSSDSGAAAGGATGATTVAVKSIDGVGKVLVDSSGKALYASDVEADGKVRCTGACTSFWQPLTVDSAKPVAAGGVGMVGVTSRPDGAKQVTVDGKLLYTFSEDAPGKVEGNGFADDFDGRHFTWNAVLAGGDSAGSSRNDDGY